jgi:protease IV
MKKATKVFLLVFGLLFVAGGGILLLFLTALFSGSSSGPIAKSTIVELDLRQPIIEYAPEDPFAQLLEEDTTRLRDILDGLEKASTDDRVKGLIANLGGSTLGLAQTQEVRDAILAFRESGKPAYAYADTFGEMSQGIGTYYLASAFDRIYLQPSGDVNIAGIMLESMFLKGTFEKLGIEVQMDHRYEYKNALNAYKESEFTGPHEEAMQRILDSVFESVVTGIGEGREMTPEEVRATIDRGPFLGQQAVDAGLVDELAYRDQVYDALQSELGDAELLYLNKYLARAGRPHTSGDVIALIYGVGPVMRGASGYDPLSGAANMGSDSVAAAIREAVRDDEVKAIVFRVDSPGGSYVASDTIWRETVRAREAGKPVIVSMGNVAGSGGYFVAISADKIVAQPTTITGSIGVLGGKMVTEAMWNKIGITWDEVHVGEHASVYSSILPYDEAGEAYLQAALDRIYQDFTEKVAEGRNLPLEEVRKIAKGRIWSGSDAIEIGLVDALGGLNTAVQLARESADLSTDGDYHLKLYPSAQTPFQLLFGEGPDNSEKATAQAQVRALTQLRPLVELGRQLGLLEEGTGVLSMPPVRVR